MSPKLKEIFSGDLFYLKCENNTSGSKVTWYFNNEVDSSSSTESYKIAVAYPAHSGQYQCEIDGTKSGTFTITVLGKCATWKSIRIRSLKLFHKCNHIIYVFTIQNTCPLPHSPSRQVNQWCRKEHQLSLIFTMTMVSRDGSAGSTGEREKEGLCWKRLLKWVWTFNPRNWRSQRLFSGVLIELKTSEVTKS